MNKFTKTAIASIFSFSAVGAYSAAFQLAEVSTSGLGMAYAGNAAVADNASVVANNPALMTNFKSTEISAGGVFVNAKVDVEGKFGTVNAAHRNVIPNALVPNMYIVMPVNDRFSLGGGVNVNYGMTSEYNDQFNAGVYGGLTKLTAMNFNLSGAYDLGYGFSFGAGLNAVYADADLKRNLGVGGKAIAQRLGQAATALAASGNTARATALSSVASQLATMPNSTVVSEIKGDKWALGWNAGLAYALNENHRWGISYRSAVNLKFKGKYSNDFPTAYNALLAQLAAMGTSLPISQATGGEQIAGRLTLNLPAVWEFSGYHKLTDRLAMQYSYKLTEWKRLKSLTAYGDAGNVLFTKAENFSNSSRYALGFSYDASEQLTLRTGFAYDQAASKKHKSISIPDTSRTWYSVGATYRFTPNLSADVGFSHLRGKKQQFTEGNLGAFNTKARANLYGLNLNYKF